MGYHGYNMIKHDSFRCKVVGKQNGLHLYIESVIAAWTVSLG